MTNASGLRRFVSWRRVRELLLYALIFLLVGYVGNLWMTRNQVRGSAPPISGQDLLG